MKKLLTRVLFFSMFLLCLPLSARAIDIYDEASLRSALNAGGDITLWQDIEMHSGKVNNDVSIDLNGYQLTSKDPFTIADNITLTVTDSQYTDENPGNGIFSIELSGIRTHANQNYGISVGSNSSFILNSGIVQVDGGETASGYLGSVGISCSSGSSFIINGGSVRATGGTGSTPAYFSSSPYTYYTGRPGIMMNSGTLRVTGGTVYAAGGAGYSTSGALGSNGGSGISVSNASTVEISGGSVTAIGATGGSNGINASSTITISGGTVNAAGGGSFDIGGNYGFGLVVTGGTVIFNSMGRATNATAPIYQNCTITGEGAYQHEGTYNADGFLTITPTEITCSPEEAHAGDSVQLTASVQVSRTTNLTTPSPKGTLQFYCDGEAIGQSKLENAAVVDGYVTASATLDWSAMGGDHIITAAYISGANDKYAAGDSQVQAECTIEQHYGSFQIVTEPTADSTGELSGTCQKCSAEVTVEIPALNGEDYSYQELAAPTCTDNGSAQYLWKEQRYGVFSFTIDLPAIGHDYEDTIVPPTCTEKGYTTHTCKNCNDTYTDTITPALGHNCNYQVSASPTLEASGLLQGTCTRCGLAFEETLPKLNTTDYHYQVVKAATCQATGTGRYVWNNTTWGSFSFSTVIPKSQHTYEDVVTPPTCTEKGYTTHTCTVCGSSYQDSETPMTNHSYAYEVTIAPTVSAAGKLKGTCRQCQATTVVTLPKLSVQDYNYEIVQQPSCTQEGAGRYSWKENQYGALSFEVTLPKTAHRYQAVITEPTCTEGGYTTHTCSACGDAYIDSYTDAVGHQYQDVVTPPTCTTSGYTPHTCSVCGESYRDNYIQATGHMGILKNAKDATCTEKGYTGDTVCTVCGVTVKTGKAIPATGHKEIVKNAKDATCTEKGYTGDTVCSVCGITIKNGTVIPATGHTETVKNVKNATCTEKGYTGDTVCSVCGVTLKTGTVIPATGHKETVKNAKDATCTEKGYTGDTVCSVCGVTLKTGTVIPATGHKETVKNAKDATCTEKGYTGDTVCSVCGVTLKTGTEIPAAGHRYDSGVVTIPATETTEGVKTFTCTVCGDTYTETIPATGKPKPPFTDVDSGAYYYDAMVWAVDNGITNGVTPTQFMPRANATRAQFVTFLWRMAGEPEPTITEHSFTDVKEGAFYYKAMLWAVEKGITKGVTATTFQPDAIVNRGQVVTFLWRYAGEPEANNQENHFADVKAGSFCYQAVLWAVENGITNGFSATSFKPQEIANRGQVVTFLYRYNQNVIPTIV